MINSTSLRRSVGLRGAVLLGLGSILGTGVFVSLGLAVGVVGHWSLYALIIAAALAAFNALSSAQLAANHPVSGGTYAYGYRYLNPAMGFVAGLCFLMAKSASAAAASLGVAGYAAQAFGWMDAPINLLAAGAVLILTVLTALGLKRASFVNTILVGITVLVLIVLVTAALTIGSNAHSISIDEAFVPSHIFEAAALLFVAFTGYGRIATLGEEVKEPRRTIPLAIILTLIVSTGLYFAVLYTGLLVLGSDGFSAATLKTAAPLQAVATQTGQPWLAVCVALGAFTAMAGVLLNLILGLSRVLLAMGRQGDMPPLLGTLSKNNEPIIAVWTVGGTIALIALLGGLAATWSFSAFTVLIYYSITNFSALKLSKTERFYSPHIPVLGLAGCLGLAVWIDVKIIVLGVLLIGAGLTLRQLLKSK